MTASLESRARLVLLACFLPAAPGAILNIAGKQSTINFNAFGEDVMPMEMVAESGSLNVSSAIVAKNYLMDDGRRLAGSAGSAGSDCASVESADRIFEALTGTPAKLPPFPAGLYLIGGSTRNNEIHKYNPADDTWDVYFAFTGFFLNGPCGVVHKGEMYIIGGGGSSVRGLQNARKITNALPLAGGRARELSARLPHDIEYRSATQMEDMIYVTSTNGDDMLMLNASSERHHAWEETTWQRSRHGSWEYQPMLEAHSGKVYAIGGGFNELPGDCCNSHHWGGSYVEAYNPATKAWSHVASMTHHRARHTSASLGDYIYVCGGRCHHCHGVSGWKYHTTCEKYLVPADSWSSAGSPGGWEAHWPSELMPEFMKGHAGYLWLLQKHATGKKELRRYDPAQNSWTAMRALPNIMDAPAWPMLLAVDADQVASGRRLLKQDTDEPAAENQVLPAFGAAFSEMRGEISEIKSELKSDLQTEMSKLSVLKSDLKSDLQKEISELKSDVQALEAGLASILKILNKD